MMEKNTTKLLGFPTASVFLPLLLQLRALFEVCAAAPNANGSNNAADRCRVTIYLRRPLLFMLKQNKKRKIRVFKAVVVLGQKNKKIDFFSRIEFDECKKIKRKRKRK
jgi:hypothetical protein